MCGRQSSYSLQKHFLGIFGLFLCPLCTSDVCWYFRRVELTRRKVCDCPDLAAQQRHFVPSVVRDRRKLSGTFILLISVSCWLIFSCCLPRWCTTVDAKIQSLPKRTKSYERLATANTGEIGCSLEKMQVNGLKV